MIILPLPRISNAGGFLDPGAIDVEHTQQRRFVAIHIGAYPTKGFLVQMERHLDRGVVTPEADAALRQIVISAWIRKMEGHECFHDTAQPRPQVIYPSVKVWLSRSELMHIWRGDRTVQKCAPRG
jgi:hypothetical protein